MDALPVKREHVWIVDERGAIEKKAPPRKLSSGQRHYHYRLGLLAVDRFMRDRGFVSNMETSTTKLSYDKSGVWIDISVKRPDNIAYVTSFPGYEYKEQVIGKTLDGQERYRPGAKVTTLKEFLGNADYIVQIMISTNDAQGTRNPIFVPLPKDLNNPSRYVLENIIGTLAVACEKIPKVKDAFTEPAAKKAQEHLLMNLDNLDPIRHDEGDFGSYLIPD